MEDKLIPSRPGIREAAMSTTPPISFASIRTNMRYSDFHGPTLGVKSLSLSFSSGYEVSESLPNRFSGIGSEESCVQLVKPHSALPIHEVDL
jgi:hypothetical protein